MSVKGRRRLLRISSDEEFQRTVPFLVYHAPEGSQTIDNSEEYERIRRCVQERREAYIRRIRRQTQAPVQATTQDPPSDSGRPHGLQRFRT